MADEDSLDEKYCSNCKKNIAVVNFIMHEMHCKRHIILCKKCKEPVPRSEEEEHFDMYHAEVNCDLCKMKIEKDQLENHMATDCPNKPSQCSYCELEIPQCDVLEHESYCGTRTEPCLSCEQYIMIKDFDRHVESSCTYPTPKPPVPSNTQTTSNLYQESMNPYAFDEIHRMLDEAMVPSLLSGAHTGSRNRFQTPAMHSVRNDTTDRSRGKNTTNRRSTVNKQNELRSTSPNGRYNSMLSQMLASSLTHPTGSNDELSQYMIDALHKESEIVPNTLASSGSSSTSPNFNNDEIMLPCEFCGDLIPSDSIIQHQSGCDPVASGSWQPHTDSQNNVVQPLIHRSTAFIPVINNLDTNRLPSWQSNDIETDRVDDNDYNVFINEDGYDEVMLPCEFCLELFPTDMLVMHQSVCDSNATVTPRVMTPATQYQPKLKPSEHRPRNYTTDDNFNKSRMTRRQPAPTLDDDGPFHNRRDMNNTAATNFNWPKDNRQTNGASSRVRKSSRQRESETQEVLDKLLQDGIDDALRESTKDVNSNKLNGSAPRVRKSLRRRESETQEILDKLLQEDIDDALRESTKQLVDSNKLNGAIGGTVDGTDPVRKKKPVHVSSRKVVQELDKNDKEKSRATRQKRSPKGVNNGENIPAVSSRHRSAHLLNADSNTRSQSTQQSQSSTRTRTNSQPKSKNKQATKR